MILIIMMMIHTYDMMMMVMMVIIMMMMTMLRNILGTKTLHEILSDREEISGAMQVRGGKIFDHERNI